MKKIACFVLLAFAALAFADKYSQWVDEDVKAIITKQERDAFKKLKTDAEKEKFIQDFWAKRDPTPGTPANENKDNYEKMLADINSKIKSKTHKGSQTDVGMTVLVLGAPDDQKKAGVKAKPTEATGDEDEEAGPSGSQVMTFIYRKLPPEIASAEVDIVFEPDPAAGEWRFKDKKAADAILDKARDYHANAAQHAQASPQVQPKPGQVTPTAPPKPTGAPVTTPEVKAALDAAATGNGPKDLTLNYVVDSFMDSKGQPFVTVGINGSGDMSADKVGVRILDASGTVVKEMEMPYTDPSEPAGYFQTEVPLTAPGQFSVAVAVAGAGKAGGIKQAVKTPDTAGFSISPIILSKKFTQLPEARPEGVAYTFGKIKVMPNVEHVFAKTDDLIIVYEAYNFQMDAAAGKPNLEVVYEFQEEGGKPQKTPAAEPHGLVTGKKITIPTSFPLANFPPGKYTLTVTLTDKANNQTASQQVSFTVSK